MGCSEVISCFIWKKFFVNLVDQCCEVDQNGLKQFKKLGKSLLSFKERQVEQGVHV